MFYRVCYKNPGASFHFNLWGGPGAVPPAGVQGAEPLGGGQGAEPLGGGQGRSPLKPQRFWHFKGVPDMYFCAIPKTVVLCFKLNVSVKAVICTHAFVSVFIYI